MSPVVAVEAAGRFKEARRHRATLLALVVFALGFLTAGANAAPVWRIDSLSNTAVTAGDNFNYLVQITNVGDASTDGTAIDLRGELAGGVTVVDATLTDGNTNNAYPCTAADGVSPVFGQAALLCTNAEAVPAQSAGASNIQILRLSVVVDGGATGTLKSRFSVSGGGATLVSTIDPTRVGASPEFGVDAFDGQISGDALGAAYTQAGGHPFAASVALDFNTITNPAPLIGDLWPVEAVKNVLVDLPAGLVGDPTGASKCTAAQLANGIGLGPLPLCAPTSQIGTTVVRLNGLPGSSVYGPLPVFNMVPPPGVPARFGFNVLGSIVVLDAELRSGADYGLTVRARNVPEGLGIAGTTMSFWGVPASAAHDGERACPGERAPWEGGPSCRSGAPATAFLRNPTSCTTLGSGLATTVRIDSWFDPGDFKVASFVSHLPPAYPLVSEDWGAAQGPTGCESVPFAPSFSGGISGQAVVAAPAGFSFDLGMPQTDDPDIVGHADLRKAVVTLPRGVRVGPASASGLKACEAGDVRLDDASTPSCPDAARIGTLTIDTPLLDEELAGAIYLAKPHENPFGALFAIYLVARGPGLVIKLPGEIDADPITGQLTATFDDNPQLPFSNLHLEFKSGPRAPLVTPKQCGTYTTHAELTSWSGRTVNSDSTFTVSKDGNGAPCPASQFSPDFEAGTENPIAGKSSPFNLALSRGDDDEELKGMTINMPQGLTGKIAKAVLCVEAEAAAGTCGDGSKVGSVTVGAGAGTNPFYITNGRAYITGPYKGAPFGMSIVVPAKAGPFDLGTVVVRASIFVDKHTSELRIVSDPLPTILEGIPLDVRDVRVNVDRDDFIVNPTSCAEKSVGGVIESTEGSTANVSSRFQVGECASLPLKPRMTLTVGGRGRTARGPSTPLNATLRQTPGQANLRSVRVVLPLSLNARLTVINDACTRAEYEAGNCAKAKAGTAVAVTPLLRDPLKGDVYFVKNGNALPDLFVALRGQVDFDLIGKITIPGGKRLATTFDLVPDVPISMFSLRLVAGRDGSVGNAANLCSKASRRQKAEIDFIGQNGRVRQVDQALRVRGCKAARASKSHKRGKGAGHRRGR